MKIYSNEIDERLYKIRRDLRLNYNQIADQLGISRTTLHHIRQGKLAPNNKVLEAIKNLEENRGGIKTESGPLKSLLMMLLNTCTPWPAVFITQEQLMAGVVNVPIIYVGTAPQGFPQILCLKRPSTLDGIAVFMKLIVNYDYCDYVLNFLPPSPINREVLERIAPQSLCDLLAVSLQLTFGSSWKMEALKFVSHVQPRTLNRPAEKTNDGYKLFLSKC